MKTTKLMIGDYVKYQGHIYIIEEISAKGWVHLIHPETKARLNLISDYIIDLLEPILLTPEILEKIGFVYNDLPMAQCWEQYGLRLCHDGDGYAISCGINISMRIVYFHQLQHCLCLCGLNDLADNIKIV